ncbi:MAG: methyl-accepting chemotaxis protein [Firmicutes bacterium]|nr:methyl-accepting chemotaxis protein [[Eubacterium] siraeum]MCM1487767.1 methyl-accepting chemotaxis protein [Bacillota bacterium]
MANAKHSMGLIKSIITTVMITITVSLLIIVTIGYFSLYSREYEGTASTAKQSLAVYTEKVNQWLEQQGQFALSQANAAAKLVEYTGDFSKNDDFIDSVMEINDSLLDCYTAYEANGELFMAVTDTSTLPADFDPRTRDWYQNAKKKNKVYFTAPYMDTATGAMIITASAPIISNGRFTGVFGCDITLDVIMYLVQEMELSENGYPVMIDDNGSFMVHGDNPDYAPRIEYGSAWFSYYDKAQGDYAKVIPQVSTLTTYFDKNTDWDGEQKYFAFRKLTTADWYLGYIFPEKDILSSTYGIVIACLIILVITAVADNMIIYAVTKIGVRPLKKMAADAAKIANGDLSVTFDYNGNDDIGKLCKNFTTSSQCTKQYIENIANTLNKMAHGDFSITVEDEYAGDYAPIKESMVNILNSMRTTFEQIGTASSQVDLGATQVAEASTNLANGVSDQTSELQNLENEVNEITEKARQTDEATATASQLAGNAKSKIEQSSVEMEKLLKAMNEISQMSNETTKIVKTIDDIAFQTNIIALNASVEAARAGSAGKGFAVVADEVRMLANKSADAAKRTSQLLQQTSSAISGGASLADTTAQSLAEAVKDTIDADEKIVQISDATKEEREHMDIISERLQHISDIVGNTSETAQATAASSEELSGQADMLSGMISKFKI